MSVSTTPWQSFRTASTYIKNQQYMSAKTSFRKVSELGLSDYRQSETQAVQNCAKTSFRTRMFQIFLGFRAVRKLHRSFRVGNGDERWSKRLNRRGVAYAGDG